MFFFSLSHNSKHWFTLPIYLTLLKLLQDLQNSSHVWISSCYMSVLCQFPPESSCLTASFTHPWYQSAVIQKLLKSVYSAGGPFPVICSPTQMIWILKYFSVSQCLFHSLPTILYCIWALFVIVDNIVIL